MKFLRSLSFMRALRLLFGAFAIIQAIITMDIILGLLGLVVGGMAFFNVGSCGSNGCSVDEQSKNKNEITDVEYEEVVIKK
jgi:hypothetical protein